MTDKVRSQSQSSHRAKDGAASSSLTVSAFFESEDVVAKKLSSEKILSSMLETIDYMRTQLDRFGTDASAWRDDVTLRDGLLLKAIELRRLNRLSNFRNRALRERLSAARAKAEAHYLQLQNAKSEIGHLKKTIDACLEFQSSDADIDLVPLEEFFEKALPDISKLSVTQFDQHQLHLARLTYELEERKSCLANLQELEGRKSVLLSDINGKAQRLQQFQPRVAILGQAARPLLELLGLRNVDAASFRTEKRLTYLPAPLHLISMSAQVHNVLFNDADSLLVIGCDGDMAKALRMARAAEDEAEKRGVGGSADGDGKADGTESDDEMEVDEKDDDFDEEGVADEEPKKKKKRKSRSTAKNDGSRSKTTGVDGDAAVKEVEALPADVGVLEAGGISGARGGGSGNALARRLQQKRDSLFTPYPLRLTVVVPCLIGKSDRSSINCQLIFSYLTELKCVALRCQLLDYAENDTSWGELFDAETLLDELYANDHGRKCMNPVGDALLKSLGVKPIDYASSVGKNYEFAQKLSGLIFAGSVAEASTAMTLSETEAFDARGGSGERQLGDLQLFELFSDMVERIRRRVADRVALIGGLRGIELTSQTIDVATDALKRYLPKTKVITRLQSFKLIGADDALEFLGLSNAQRTLWKSLDAGGVSGFSFTAAFDYRTRFSLNALIYMPAAYPRDAPVFLLVLPGSGDITDDSTMLAYAQGVSQLERFVNVKAVELVRRCGGDASAVSDDLLLFQLAALRTRFDVVVEVIVASQRGDQSSSLEHNYVALSRGRHQELPFAFNEKTNAFGFEWPL